MSTPSLPPRYEHLGTLGEGGMGQVLRVRDRETGQEVALKRLRVAEGEDEAQARFLFRQEFWNMTSLRHPNLVEALDFGEGPDGVPYMTMALVPGRDLAPGCPEAEARAWLPQIAAALAFLHGRGYVHGDLKPENIRIREDGTAILMDLGLLMPAGRSGEAVRGSIYYMAPEVIRQGAIDARSDLYALGAVLYHVLAGKPPFDAAAPIAVLRAHLEARPERLQRRAEVSPEMDAAVMRLLAKEPAARFASAGEVLASLDMQATVDERAGLLASPIIGRDAAQAALRAAAQADGRVWLVGPAGSGKTRLLGEARAEAQLAGSATIALQGLGADAAPYQALQPLFRSLAGAALAGDPQHAAVLARVLPDLGTASGQGAIAPAPALDGAAERLRLQGAVAALARAAHPRAIWLIDAADALDPASRELLARLQREEGASWAWVWAAEALDAGAIAEQRSKGAGMAEVVALAALGEADVLAIARQRLGQADLPAGLADWLVPLTAGSPGAIEALLNHWIQAGTLTRAGGRWTAAGTFELPGGLRVALDARLEAASDDARLVARTAAVLGATGELRWLAGVAGLDDARFFAALRELVAADVLGADERAFRFARASQAVALAASWDEADRLRLHDAAADWLIQDGGHSPDDAALPTAAALAIADHTLAGATPARAVPWVRTAADRAIGQFTLEPADALLRRALALDGLDEADRLALERRQATVWRLQGRGRDALARFEEADLLGRLARHEDPALVDETLNYGALVSLVGRYADARQVLGGAIAQADARGLLAASVRGRILAGRAAYFAGDAEAARALLAEAVAKGREAVAAGQPAGLALALSFHGYFLAAGGAVDEGLAALAEAVELAGASGNPVQANEAQSMRGNVCIAESRPLEAKAAFEAILETCRKFELPHDELMARVNLAAAWLDLGDARKARSHAEQGVATAQANQRKVPEAFGRAVAGRARIQMGELAAGWAELAAAVALARELNNRYLELHVMPQYADGLVALGRRAEAEQALAGARAIAAELNNTEHDRALTRVEMRLALQNALAAENPLTALAAAGERLAAWAARLRAEVRPGDLAHALVLQAAWALRLGDMPAGTSLTDEAATLAEATGQELLAAEVGYIRARLAAAAALVNSSVAGLINAAVTGFARSGERAQELGDVKLDLLCKAGALTAQNMMREIKKIAKEFADLTDGQTDEEADEFLEQPDLREIMSAFPTRGLSAEARDVISLMASFDADTNLNRLLKRAVASMVEFAGSKRGFLLLFDAMDVTHKVVYGMTAEEADAFSSSLAYQVLWSEQPLFVEDAQMDGYFSKQASVRALDLRSIVGVPLLTDDGAIGVLIADSQTITIGFGDAHLDLLAALGRRVAAGIGMARKREAEARAKALDDMVARLRQATSGATQLEAFVAPIAAEALTLTGADRACVVLGPELECRVAVDRAGKALPAADQHPSQSACRWVAEHGEALHLHDVEASASFSARQSVMALGLRTIHAVPIAHDRAVKGVLYLDDRRVGREDPQITEALRRLGSLLGSLV